MTDITPIFDDLLVKNGKERPKRQLGRLKLESVDDFIDEAYKINSQIASLHAWLKNIRQSYLSSAQPSKLSTRHKNRDGAERQKLLTNQDREEIDVNTKSMLRELNGKIQNLSAADAIRHNTRMALIEKKYRGGFGALGAWAAGGSLGGKSLEHSVAEQAVNTITTHRNNVVFYLRERLQLCTLTQSTMMETRIRRERENQKSILAKAGHRMAFNLPTSDLSSRVPPDGVAESKTYRPEQEEQELTSEQIQIFEKKNQDLLRQDEATLNQVRNAEKSLVEIAELQQELINNLTMQSEHIDQLVQDSFQAAEDVGGGNKELQKASEKPSTARRIFFSTSAFCAFLIFWDLIF